jgi:membrane fusion protein, heavy metal efflux system
VEKNINPGQEVRSDQMLANVPQLSAPLFVVSDPNRLAILIDATERDLVALHPGIPFQVRSDSIRDRTFSGVVDWVSDALDPTTRRVTVRGLVENPDRLLKAEMFVTAEFESAGTSNLAAPAEAVIMKAEKHFVFVEEKAGSYARREVEIGSEQKGNLVVLRGLRPGERVVTHGSVLLDELQASGGGAE